MNVRISNLEETPLVEAWGDIDHGSSADLAQAFDEIREAGASVVLLDLGRVDYIDSGGLSVLFSEVRRLPEGGWLGLIAPNANVHRLLEIVGMFADPRFKVFTDRAGAQNELPAQDPSR